MYLGNTKTPVKVKFTQVNYRGNINRCTKFPYTINDSHEKYGKLFVESVSLYDICNWNGHPLSLLEGKIRFLSGIDSMKSLEKIEVNNYVFKTYLINEKEHLSIIYIYGMKDTFIIDNDGILYAEVLKTFDKDYNNKFESKPRYQKVYDKSMVRDNIIYSYFQREPFVAE